MERVVSLDKLDVGAFGYGLPSGRKTSHLSNFHQLFLQAEYPVRLQEAIRCILVAFPVIRRLGEA